MFTSISDDIWGVIRKNPPVSIFLSAQRIEQVFPKTRPIPLIGHTMYTHTRTHTYTVSPLWLSSGLLDLTQNRLMRKRIAVFHQQLSPAAPVRLKCASLLAMQLLRKYRYPSRSWQGNIPKVDSGDWMLLLKSISSCINILFTYCMYASSLNGRGEITWTYSAQRVEGSE